MTATFRFYEDAVRRQVGYLTLPDTPVASGAEVVLSANWRCADAQKGRYTVAASVSGAGISHGPVAVQVLVEARRTWLPVILKH